MDFWDRIETTLLSHYAMLQKEINLFSVTNLQMAYQAIS